MRNSKDLYESFGFDTQPILIGLIIFQVSFLCIMFYFQCSHYGRSLLLVVSSPEFYIMLTNFLFLFFYLKVSQLTLVSP